MSPRVVIISLVLLALLAGGAMVMVATRLHEEDLRREVIRKAEALTGGSEVLIEGPVELSILPRLTVTVADVRIATPDRVAQGIKVAVDRMDLLVDPLALLHGTLAFSEVRLISPVVELVLPERRPEQLDEDGPDDPLWFVPPAHRVSIAEGQMILIRGPEAVHEIEHIDLELQPDDEQGPFRLEAGFVMRDQAFDLDARLGRLTGDPSTTLQLELAAAEGAPAPFRIAFRGLVAWPEPSLRGRVAITGDDAKGAAQTLAVALGARKSELPPWLARSFEIRGALAASGAELKLGELEVGLDGLEAMGRLQVDATRARPELQLDLTAPRLELDRASDLHQWFSAVLIPVSSALGGEIDLTAGSLGQGDDGARRVRVTLRLPAPGRVEVVQLRALLPGQTDVQLSGTVTGEAGDTRLDASLTAVSSGPSELLKWLGLTADLPAGLSSFSLASDLSVGRRGTRASDIDLQLDATRLSGSIALEHGDRQQIAAAVVLDRLDLDTYLPELSPRALMAWLEPILAATDFAVEAQLDRLTWQGQRLREVALDLRATAGEMAIEQLALRGPASTLTLGGRLQPAAERFELEATLKSERPALLLRRLGFAPPPGLGRLAPMVLDARLDGVTTAFKLDLTARAGEVQLAAAGDVSLAEAWPPAYTLRLEASHPDYLGLTRQLGLASVVADGEPGEPFRLAGTLRRQPTDALTFTGSAELASTRVVGEIGWEQGADASPRLEVELSLSEPALENLMPLWRAAGGPPPGLTIGRPLLGNLPQQPLGLDRLVPLEGTIEISGTGGLAGDGLELRAILNDRRLNLEHLTMPLLDGRLESQVSLDLSRQVPFLGVALSLEKIDTERLTRWLGLPPVIQGRADLYTEATLAGHSPFQLARALAGDVIVSLQDGVIEGISLSAASSKAAEQADQPGAPMQDARTRFSIFGGQFEVRRGIATPTAVQLELEEIDARLEGIIDLLLWTADLTVMLETQEGDRPLLRLVGPLDRLQVSHPLEADRSELTPESAVPAALP